MEDKDKNKTQNTDAQESVPVSTTEPARPLGKYWRPVFKQQAYAKQKHEAMYEMYISRPNMDHSEMLHAIAKEFKVKIRAVYKVCKKDEWVLKKEKLMSELHQMSIAETVLSRSVKNDIALSALVSVTKDISHKLLNTALQVVGTSQLMIGYYTKKIQDTVVQRTNGRSIELLSKDDIKEIEVLQKGMNLFIQPIKEWLQPSAIVTYLRAVGVDSIEPEPEGYEHGAFTMNKLQGVLVSFGMATSIPKEKVEEAFAEVMPNLPQIEASTVVNAQPQGEA